MLQFSIAVVTTAEKTEDAHYDPNSPNRNDENRNIVHRFYVSKGNASDDYSTQAEDDQERGKHPEDATTASICYTKLSDNEEVSIDMEKKNAK